MARAGPPTAPSPRCLRPLLSLTPARTPAPCRAERGVGTASASQREPEAQRRQARSGEEPRIAAWPRSAGAEGAPLSPAPAPAESCHWQPDCLSSRACWLNPAALSPGRTELRHGLARASAWLQHSPSSSPAPALARAALSREAEAVGGGRLGLGRGASWPFLPSQGALHAPTPTHAAGCWTVSSGQDTCARAGWACEPGW